MKINFNENSVSYEYLLGISYVLLFVLGIFLLSFWIIFPVIILKSHTEHSVHIFCWVLWYTIPFISAFVCMFIMSLKINKNPKLLEDELFKKAMDEVGYGDEIENNFIVNMEDFENEIIAIGCLVFLLIEISIFLCQVWKLL